MEATTKLKIAAIATKKIATDELDPNNELYKPKRTEEPLKLDVKLEQRNTSEAIKLDNALKKKHAKKI